jgi:alanine transaminase
MPVTLRNAYQGAVKCEYAVRGRVVARAMEAEAAGKKVVYCNIGNPQSFHQKPLTFARQVLALCAYPSGLMSTNLFPSDAKSRANRYMDGMAGRSSGSYTHSAGIRQVREDVAEFIRKRDNDAPCNPDDLFLTDGAGPGAQMLVRLLIRGPQDGMMVPVPRYPLYSALLDLVNGTRIDYFLDEKNGWQFTKEELDRSYREAKSKGVNVRALVIVNPGNPTGQVMSKESQQGVVEFCAQHDIVLLADEVYQENIWAPNRSFTSFKKIAHEMGKTLELASLHSVSKGFFGECGRRGGYVEMSGFQQDVKDVLYKMASVNLCSNVDGQITMGVMCKPPVQGEESHELFNRERNEILESLRRRALIVGNTLASEGLECVVPEGALYAFPRVMLPEAFVKKHGPNPDEAYCLELLDKTGVVVVPGAGFGQEEGTFHFRTTLLPPEKDLPEILGRVVEFHSDLLRRYRS